MTMKKYKKDVEAWVRLLESLGFFFSKKDWAEKYSSEDCLVCGAEEEMAKHEDYSLFLGGDEELLKKLKEKLNETFVLNKDLFEDEEHFENADAEECNRVLEGRRYRDYDDRYFLPEAEELFLWGTCLTNNC